MILPIVAYGNDILRTKCLPMDDTVLNRELIANIKETIGMIPTSVGLASPQVNTELQMFAIRILPHLPIQIFINPIIRKRRGKQKSEEGCLSIPDLYREIPSDIRDDIIDVEYYDEKFNKQRVKLKGFESIVFQHEYDHLQGILFIDYLTKEGKEEAQDRLAEIEKGNVQTLYKMIFK